MYNRYFGNTGRVVRVSDSPAAPSDAVGKAALPVSAVERAKTAFTPPESANTAPDFDTNTGSASSPREAAGFSAAPAPSHGGKGEGAAFRAARPVSGPPPGAIRPPWPLSGLSGELGRLLSRLSPMKLETDDLLLMMVLYLMYRESHDEELLFIMAAMLFL